jgi:uncharacterized membrane protein YphA (DoxX/SURF4 family)
MPDPAKLMISSSAILAVRVLLGSLLAVTGIGKLANHRTFVLIVRSYKLVPEASVGALCWLLPLAEVVLATLLFAGRLLPWAALGAGGLFVVFSLAVSINLVRGHRDMPCGCCGKATGGRIGWHVVLRNLGLVGLAAVSGGIRSYVPHVALSSALLFILPVVAVGLKRRRMARKAEERA